MKTLNLTDRAVFESELKAAQTAQGLNLNWELHRPRGVWIWTESCTDHAVFESELKSCTDSAVFESELKAAQTALCLNLNWKLHRPRGVGIWTEKAAQTALCLNLSCCTDRAWLESELKKLHSPRFKSHLKTAHCMFIWKICFCCTTVYKLFKSSYITSHKAYSI